MTDRAYIISRTFENKIAMAENNGVDALLVSLDVLKEILSLLKEQDAVVHPEPSCEMTYFTDCCCDLCGVQLIREDNFCRCCGKRIEWESR